jgi:hypothetical protein
MIGASVTNMQGRHATAGKHTLTLYAYDTAYNNSQATSTVCTRSTCSPIIEENNPAIAYAERPTIRSPIILEDR